MSLRNGKKMRFIFIDRFLKLTKDESVVALKIMSNDFIKEHFPKKPVIPCTMVIESIAQMGFWLVIYANEFKYRTILAILRDSGIKRDILPGDRIECHARIISRGDTVSEIEAKGYVCNELVAWADVVLSHPVAYEKKQRLNQIKRFNYLTGLRIDPGDYI